MLLQKWSSHWRKSLVGILMCPCQLRRQYGLRYCREISMASGGKQISPNQTNTCLHVKYWNLASKTEELAKVLRTRFGRWLQTALCEIIAPKHRPLTPVLRITSPLKQREEWISSPRIKWWRFYEKKEEMISPILSTKNSVGITLSKWRPWEETSLS